MRPLLLGHRGARAYKKIPENTIASFELAMQHGCDGFEFDVRQSKDGEAVICHDAKWQGKTISRTPVGELGLPKLEQILQRFADRAFLDIELKVGGLEKQTLGALQEHPRANCVISSFLPDVIYRLNDLNSRVTKGIICENKTQLSRWRALPVKYVIARKDLVNKKLVDEIHAAGRLILVWTVNRSSTMKRFASYGVDGIISDETERLVSTLCGMKNPSC